MNAQYKLTSMFRAYGHHARQGWKLNQTRICSDSPLWNSRLRGKMAKGYWDVEERHGWPTNKK